jgi:hypothetical protein
MRLAVILLGVLASVALELGAGQAAVKGPHGGQVMKVSSELQVELVAEEKGLNVYVLDQASQTLPADQLKKLSVKVTLQPKGQSDRVLKSELQDSRFVIREAAPLPVPSRVKVDVKVGFHGHSASFDLPQVQK